MRASEPPADASPLLSAILKGTAPRHMKLAAARGVLPLPTPDLVRVLVALAGDGEPEIRDEASGRLRSLPSGEIAGLLADPAVAPEVLDHFGGLPDNPDEVTEALITNPSTSPACLQGMAPSLPVPLIDMLLRNETKLIESPFLLDALQANAALTRPQATRIEEIRRHFLQERPPSAPGPEIAPAPGGEAALPPPAEEPEPPSGMEAPQEGGETETTEEISREADGIDNANQKIMRLNTAEKIQLAFKGNREERSILIRDSSKTVQQAVLKSPKLSEREVEAIAKMRTVTEEVLRMITRNRDWMKNYVVVHSLSTNPKTPVGIAMNLLSRLNSRDLRLIAADKNVAEVIRRQARKVQEGRTQRPGKR